MKDVDNMVYYYNMMRQLGLRPNGNTFYFMIKMFYKREDWASVIKYYTEMSQLRVDPTLGVLSMMKNVPGGHQNEQ